MKRFIPVLLSLFYLNCKQHQVKIAILLSLSGPASIYGKQVIEGVKLAQMENKDMVVNGYRIGYIIEDIESSTELTRRKTEWILRDNKDVIAVVGPEISQLALISAKVCQKYNVLFVTPTATQKDITAIGDYIFRVSYTDPEQGYAIAIFARNRLKAQRAGILYEANNPYSDGLARSFEKTFSQLGGEVVYSTFYLSGDSTFSSQLKSLKAMNPDVLFIPGYVYEVVNAIKQSLQMNFTPIFLGGDGWHSNEVAKLLGPYTSSGMVAYITSPFSPADSFPETQKFVKAFKKKYSKIPEVSSALGYDALNLIFKAIKTSSSLDRNEIKNSFSNVDNYRGATGVISYNGNRDPIRDVFILKLTQNGFTPVERFTPPK